MATNTIHIALVGNPNSGKTSLFNTLTGLNQKVGNFPGVTVDKKTGEFKTPDLFRYFLAERDIPKKCEPILRDMGEIILSLN